MLFDAIGQDTQRKGLRRRHGFLLGRTVHIVYKVETEVETDGRWIAEIPNLPGVLAYGSVRVPQVLILKTWVLSWRVGQAFELGAAPGWPHTGMVARPIHRDIKTGSSASRKTVRVTPPNIPSLT